MRPHARQCCLTFCDTRCRCRITHSITLQHRAHGARKQRTRAIIYGHGGCGSATNQPDRPPILPASSWRAQIDGDSVVNAPYPEPISSCKVDEIGNMAARNKIPSSGGFIGASRGPTAIEEVACAEGEWWEEARECRLAACGKLGG